MPTIRMLSTAEGSTDGINKTVYEVDEVVTLTGKSGEDLCKSLVALKAAEYIEEHDAVNLSGNRGELLSQLLASKDEVEQLTNRLTRLSKDYEELSEAHNEHLQAHKQALSAKDNEIIALFEEIDDLKKLLEDETGGQDAKTS